MKTLLENFLVQPCAVEAGLLGKLDVALERCVARGGTDAVGIKALVEHKPLVERLVVQQDPVALEVNFTQTGVAADRSTSRPERSVRMNSTS